MHEGGDGGGEGALEGVGGEGGGGGGGGGEGGGGEFLLELGEEGEGHASGEADAGEYGWVGEWG